MSDIKNSFIASNSSKKEKQYNKLFSRSLKEMSGEEERGLKLMASDCFSIKYLINSQGYRCNEFDNQEILTLGCSQTEGHGLPLELTWPYIISKKMNKDYINLAKGGDGIQGQVVKAFQFFKEFYNPKYIFAVFPLTRLEVPLIKIRSKSEKNNRYLDEDCHITRVMFNNESIEKFSKVPHLIEEVVSEEFAIFYNILFMRMLSQYCQTNNIKLIWTHYYDTSVKIPLFQESIPGYFESFYLNGEVKLDEECHSEFSNNELFYYAADRHDSPPGHWGLHRQLHIVDSIYNML